MAISPQDPIATEFLEKALIENASSETLFQSAVRTPDGEIVIQDDEDVDLALHERMLRSRLKAKAGSGGLRYGGDGGEGNSRSSRRTATGNIGERRRLGDVTSNYQEVGGESMEVSDEDL